MKFFVNHFWAEDSHEIFIEIFFFKKLSATILNSKLHKVKFLTLILLKMKVPGLGI